MSRPDVRGGSAEIEHISQAMLEIGELPAADPLRRRLLASDLRAALLHRLAGDGLIGAEECGGGG